VEGCVIFRVPFGYQFHKHEFKILDSGDYFYFSGESFFHPSPVLVSAESTVPYKSLFPPTARFITPVFFTSAQLPNLIHLLGLFLP
jgi:hypothetical protein